MLKSFNALTEEELDFIYTGGGQTTKAAQKLAQELRIHCTGLTILSELENLLELVYTCTLGLEGDGVTISRVLPYIRSLKQGLRDIRTINIDDLRLDLLLSTEKRFNYIGDEHLFGIASILDPNYCIYWLEWLVSRLVASINHSEMNMPLSTLVNETTIVYPKKRSL
jgi:hypothetical protein